MKILIAKGNAQFNTHDVPDFKGIDPMDNDEIKEFLAESIHFAQVEGGMNTAAGFASAILIDMIKAGMLVIQPEVDSA